MKNELENRAKVSELQHIHEMAVSEFQSYYTEGQNNKRYAKGRNWTSEQEKKIRTKEHRQPYSMPLIAVKCNRLLSEQRNNRFDWKPRGRGAEDEITAEIGGYLMKYIDDNNSLKFVESEVYQDGLTGKYGVCQARIDTTKDVRGEIILEKVPFNECLWDTNAKKYDLSDAEFFERFYWTTKRKLILDYPKLEEQIKKLTYDDYQKNEPVKDIKNWLRTDDKKDIVKVVQHYEKINKTVYLLKNLLQPEVDLLQFDTKKELESYIKEQIQQSQGQITGEMFKTLTVQKEFYKETIFCAYDILEEKETEYLPYCVYFCFYDDGDFWSIIDLARDPQLMYDRYIQMIDKSTSKNIRGNNYTLIPDYLHPTETKNLNKLTGDLVDGGRVVLTQKHEILAPIPHNNNIGIESQFVEIAQSLIEDIFGGRTFQGLNAEKKQTATESRILENQAKVGVFLYLDNLVRWKTQLGQLVWKMMGEVYTEERQIRIMGEVLSDEMKKMLSQQGSYQPSKLEPDSFGYISIGNLPKKLSSTTVDIVIDKVEASSTARLQKYVSLIGINDYMIRSGYQPIPIEVILEYSDIDYTDKQKLIAYEKEQQAQQQKAMAEQKSRANIQGAMEVLKNTKDIKQPEQQKSLISSE